MEWWQYLAISVVSAFVGYLLSTQGAKNERAAAEKRQSKTAVGALLGEVRTNERIAKADWTETQVPFLTEMWSHHKSEITKFPEEEQDKIAELYHDVTHANAIVIHLTYRRLQKNSNTNLFFHVQQKTI